MSGEGKVVCVTGGSGFIASWLVKLLLQRGYTVRATVRDLNDPKKTEHLRALDGAKERLILFNINLLDEGGFNAVVDGCEGVFHTASPVILTTNNPEADLIEPALKGTLNVLKSCAKAASIKRVIVTSSMAAVAFNGKAMTPDVVVDETWFSDPSFCESQKLWYMLSKTLAEEAAWKFAKENGIDMVTINPGYVIGPILQPTLNLTTGLISESINARTFPDNTFRFVDVRDVANAHIQAFEVSSASGRYCLVGRVGHFVEILKIVREHYPNLHFPEEVPGSKYLTIPSYSVSTDKAKTLGINFTPLEVTVIDAIESLKEKGFVKQINGPINYSMGSVRMSGQGKMVCVTGASGYIASWLVKCLLQRGYTVKATVLHLYDPNQTEHLLALDGATERLKLFEADLLKEGSFDPAVEGCEGVFHTASPVLFSPTDPQTELLDPAIKGTLNVLKSCIKVNSLKRVILTSSLVAVAYRGKPFTSDMLVDETWVSDPSHLEEQRLWYNLSKTLAEQAAWRFAKENRIDLVTIHPGFVIGPPLQPTLNVTLEMLLNLIKGSQVYPNGYYRSVDVRNVADAHIQAFEIPSASGRYCLVGSNVHFSDLLNIVRHQYPELHLPEKCDYENDALKQFNVSQERAKTLGINFTPLEVTLKDTIESLKEKGFLRI